MKLVFCHESGLEWLRHRRSLGLETPKRARITTLSDCACSQKELSRFPLPEPLNRSDRLHIIAPNQNRQMRSSTHVCHVWNDKPPLGSLIKVNNGVFVPSPELLFVQMATHLDFIDLILLGMELCGTYTMMGKNERSFVNCPAATTKAQLIAYVNRASGMHGRNIANKALRWVIAGSNSPAESSLALFLTLSPRLGGYGMPQPSLNPKKQLGARATQLYGYDKMRCDLHWTKQHVVVEYSSSQEHLNPRSAAVDAKRANTLGYKRTTLLTVTPQMISHPTEFDAFVKQLAKALRKRPSRQAFVLSSTRRDLREQLFPWLKGQLG